MTYSTKETPYNMKEINGTLFWSFRDSIYEKKGGFASFKAIQVIKKGSMENPTDKVGYCSNTSWARRFCCEDNNVDLMRVQPHYYRVR